MIKLGEEMAAAYHKRFIGSVQPVLVEKVVPEAYGEGFSPHYLRVRIYSNNKSRHWRGKLINARLESIDGPHLKAVAVYKR